MPCKSVDEGVRFPYSQVEIGTGENIEENGLVEFRLLFSGELLSTGNKSKPSEVHAIRRSFHPQLRRLWMADENLLQLAKSAFHGGAHLSGVPRPSTEEERFDAGIKTIGAIWNRAGFDWVPLVTPDMALRCSIDILLLRPDIEERFIFRRGDIDGQVKTLFDAFRIPENTDEVGNASPQHDEVPFFCLLQDDRLITEVRVTTDRLLLLPNQKDIKPNDCLAVIHIKLNARNARTFDNWIG